MHEHYSLQGHGQYLGKDEHLHDLDDLRFMTPEPMALYPTAKAAQAEASEGLKPVAVWVNDDTCIYYCSTCDAEYAQCEHDMSDVEIARLNERCPWTLNRRHGQKAR